MRSQQTSQVAQHACGHYVGYLKNYFEFDIRNFDQWLRARGPETFATALDENPRAKHAVVHHKP
jgi:hypothetical protein